MGFGENAQSRASVSTLNHRFKYLCVFLVCAFFLMVGRLWHLQILQGASYLAETKENVVSRRLIPPVRGKILDRRGEPLADNRPAFAIYADTKAFTNVESLETLKIALGLNEDESLRVQQRLERAWERKTRRVLILEDQPRERAALIRQGQLQWTGLDVRDEPYRHYPKGRLAAHVVGYMNQITNKDLEAHQDEGYLDDDRIGRYGIERVWETYLRGKRGIERFVVNAKGQRVESAMAAGLLDEPAFESPSEGHNIVLTLDARLQNIVEKNLLRYAAGAVAVVDVHSGRVLALASTPAFDPNEMSGKLSRARYGQLLSDPRKPFVDKALRNHYPPGSTYKFVTALAALEGEDLAEEEELSCGGRHKQGKRVFRCTSSHGKLGLVNAIRHSCNIFFWKLSERVGIDRMAEMAREFGLGEPTGIGLNGDVKGNIPTRAWYEERDRFRIGYTLNAATGQGDVEVGVLQLAVAYSAIANGGFLYQPQLVERVETSEQEIVVDYERILRRRLDVSPLSLATIREGMFAVVNHKKGTAYKYARSSEVDIAGKTGTAQVRGFQHRDDDNALRGWDTRRDHAWFAGFAPADDPEIAFVVLIEHGGSGGKEAGPVARDIVEEYFGENTSSESQSIGDAP